MGKKTVEKKKRRTCEQGERYMLLMMIDHCGHELSGQHELSAQGVGMEAGGVSWVELAPALSLRLFLYAAGKAPAPRFRWWWWISFMS